MKANQTKSIIDLVIELEEIKRKPKLVSDEEVEAKVKEIYGTPEMIEKEKKRHEEFKVFLNELMKTI